MGSDTALCLVTASAAASLTRRMGKEARWLLVHSPGGRGNSASSAARSMLLSDMDGGRRGKGSMLLTSPPLEPAVCCLSQGRLIQSRGEQPAEGHHGLVGFYFHERAGVAGTCPLS